jgi:NitT/TauT family transport system ATP-binding protein
VPDATSKAPAPPPPLAGEGGEGEAKRTEQAAPPPRPPPQERERGAQLPRNAAPPKVELRDVGLRYFGRDGETEALKGISLAIPAGAFVAIIGQSGCGKSTLLSLISGILQPTGGAVLIDGHPVIGPSRKVGYMLQQDYLFEWRTILENAVLGAEIQGLDIGKARARATALLTRYGLGQFLNRRPRELSGGMRQRVALARTLVTEPDVVLLDEPFSALDSQTRLALADEVVEILRRERKTAILVTHDIGEAISMTERVVVLSRRPGQVKSDRAIRFATADGARPAPFAARNAPEFNGYFNTLWQELEVHVEG